MTQVQTPQANPQAPLIFETGNTGARSDVGGGSVFAVLLLLLVIGVVAIPLILRREPIAERSSAIGDVLPALMLMQSSSQRQAVEVNSNNTNTCGPSNFQLYQQGVETNNNNFVQSNATRELIRDETAETREAIRSAQLDNLRDALEVERAARTADRIAFEIERSNNSQTLRMDSLFNALQRQIDTLGCSLPKNPVAAYPVSPYGAYTPAPPFRFAEHDDRRCC